MEKVQQAEISPRRCQDGYESNISGNLTCNHSSRPKGECALNPNCDQKCHTNPKYFLKNVLNAQLEIFPPSEEPNCHLPASDSIAQKRRAMECTLHSTTSQPWNALYISLHHSHGMHSTFHYITAMECSLLSI